MTDPTPYVARNGNRFTPEQARVITEPLRYDPREEVERSAVVMGH